MLKTGTNLPAFNLESSAGGNFSDKDVSDKYGVIIFYPKNNTPG
ncbi:MAG: hypothetical protein DWP97_01390 [Calditrichaeota bacterium]|nr:MAG: hypothetical protein DWP97_01390 [Calditrichota bacterium]